MADQDHSNLPYKPRQRRARPDRPLPAPPPEEDAWRTTTGIENNFDGDYMSPPSPPRAPVQPTYQPPPIESLSIAEDKAGGNGDAPESSLAEAMATSLGGGGGDSAAAPAPPPPRPAAAPRVRPPVPKTNAQYSSAHINPYHTTLPSGDLVPPTILTPLRAHYLKKSLVNMQIAYEINMITNPVLGANALGLLGPPFVLPDAAKEHVAARVGSEAVPSASDMGDLPFLRFMFHQFLLPFPFLAAAPPSFWSAKVQPFLSSFLATTGMVTHSTLTPDEQDVAESLMTKDERKEAEERRKLWVKVEKHLGLMIGVGIKLDGGEEVVRISQSELRRIEATQQTRHKKWADKHPQLAEAIMFDVNVVGVRAVVEKGRVRSRSHEEFIIRTQRSGVHDVFVSRRYGDFRRLAEELRAHFPEAPLPNPPPKNKTVSTAPPATAQGYSAYNPMRMIYGSGVSPSPSGASTPKAGAPPTPGLDEQPESPLSPGPLSRERNRLTLRAYLGAILAIPEIANSPIMRSFLLSQPTTLTPPEAADIQRRLEADAVREEGRKRFREEAERRVEALREGLSQFKGDVLTKEGGLKGVFEVVRRVERVEDLPPAERSVLEWGRISLAATIFQIYVASDTASDSLAGLKRLHGIMPYFVLKGILKISNPMAMIRGVLDLFLARPFGGQSLLQRMFSTSLNEDVRYLQEDIQAVQDKIDDPVLCQKIEQYVQAPFEIQEMYRRDAVTEGLDLLVVILRSPDMPILSRPQVQRVYRAARAYREYKKWQQDLEDSDDDEGPDNDDAWLFEDLNILMKLMTRKREKESMLALIFEGVTAELLKDIITIFYSPLATVYKAASIADSLGDLQSFINDMIRTVEQVEELSQEDPQRTVQTFIDLVQRHEQAFYSFVHNVHSKGQGLFDSLMGWIELFLGYARDGLPQKLDLEILLPMDGPQRAAIMKEVDEVAQYHYKLKVQHEEKVRRRFVAGGGADEQTLEEAALVDSVMQSLSIGDTTVGAAGEIAVEESEEDDDSEDDYDHEWDDSMSESSSVQSGQGASGSGSGPSSGPRAHRHGSIGSSPLVPENQARKPATSSGARTSLDAHRKNARSGSTSSQDSALPPPPPPKDGGGNGSSASKRAADQPGRTRRRRKRQQVVLVPPEIKAITELRPLFVEVVKEMLVVKPLTP